MLVDGEIDAASVGTLSGALTEAFAQHPETIAVDLGTVTFVDSSGMHALLRAHRRCRATGIRLVIVRADATVHEPFVIAGLDELLPFTDPPRE